jgi:hypothetical protein
VGPRAVVSAISTPPSGPVSRTDALLSASYYSSRETAESPAPGASIPPAFSRRVISP